MQCSEGNCPRPTFQDALSTGDDKTWWRDDRWTYRRDVYVPSITAAALWLWFGGWAVALAVVDIREHRLPNAMVGCAFAGCVLITAMGAASAAHPGVLLRSGIASALAVAAFSIAHLVGGMGMGDVKYAAVTGWVLGTIGWWAVWWGHLIGFMAAGAVVMIGVGLRVLQRRSAVPFGPFMGAGTLTVGLSAVMLPVL